ncbi:MAG TPA: tetratricopeptide repeat protein [Asticcacaulis sp.]|nr:tetratricopeptide repeat protein [Asticcacaulis sp.]
MRAAIGAVIMGLSLTTVPALAGGFTVTDCRPHDPAQEAADAALIDQAVPLMQAHDQAALAALRPEVDAALSHAPDVATLPEQCGNTIVIYSGDTRVFFAARDRIGRDPRFAGANIQLRAAMPYATLGFIAGWIAYEQGDLDGAARAYGKGLLNEPADPNLASEYGNVLARQGQFADALTFLDGFLAANPGLDPIPAAQLQRRRGYALAELQRYDEALAAYNESLRLDPTNPAAASEIDYINRKKTLRN